VRRHLTGVSVCSSRFRQAPRMARRLANWQMDITNLEQIASAVVGTAPHFGEQTS